MRRHLYIVILIAIITTLILTQPIQSAPPTDTSYCIAGPEACYPSFTEERCQEEFNVITSNPLIENPLPNYFWKDAGTASSPEMNTAYDLYCARGCCQLADAPNEEDVSQYTCTQLGGIDWYEYPDSCPETQPQLCGGQDVPAGQHCCGETISEDPCPVAPTEPGEEYEIPDTCGNGEWDTGEICDDPYLGICPTGDFVQRCTMNCRCAIDPSLYEEFDGYCYPGAPGCDYDATCANIQIEAPRVEAVTATNRARATWELNVPPACEDSFVSFVVIAQAEGVGSSSPVVTDSSQRSAEFVVQGDRITYSVFVRLTLSDGTSTDSGSTSYTSGHQVCFGEQRSMCTEEGLLTCDQENNALSTECSDCYQGIGFDGTLQATCGPSVVCDACNAAYNNFGEVYDGYIPVTWGDETDSFACENLASYQVGEIEVALCRLEYTDTALQEYLSCEPTQGCAQYGTQDACAQNICGSAGTCEWNAEYGICTAQEIEHQVCDAESRDLCEAQGSGCRWVGSECVEHRQICEDYNDEQTCTGGTPFSLNHDTNQEITFSQDAIGLGKCKWGTPGNTVSPICYKDANDDNVRDRNNPLSLRSDFTNPTTTLLGNTDATWGSSISIPFVVDEEATTYADLIPGTCGAITRPVTQHGDVILFENRESREYCLHYYSEDRANNLEYVRQVPITVDTTQLAFTDIITTVTPGPVNDEMPTSTIQVQVHLNRPATCSVSLEQLTPESDELGPEGTQGPNDRFVRSWLDLPDGQYRVTSVCNIPQGTPITDETTILLNSDGRMTLSLPDSGVYRNDDLTQASIHTLASLPASCSMQYGTQTFSLARQAQPVVINNQQYIRHSATLPQLPQGFNELVPTCEFADFTLSNPVLNIRLGIDELPPVTIASITVDDVERTISEGTVPVGSEGRDVRFHCTKEAIEARESNWNASCETTYVDTGNGFNPYSGSLRMNPGDTVRVYSVDDLGNQETPRTFTAVNIDVSGPRLECFWIEEDSVGTVSSQCE